MTKYDLEIGKTYFVDIEPRSDQPQNWEKMTYRYEVKHQDKTSYVFKRTSGALYALTLFANGETTLLIKEIR